MPHIVTIHTQVRDPQAVQAACRRLGLEEPVQKTVQLYSGPVTGLAVQLPGWNYPAVCDLNTGQVQFDNYDGAWKGQT